MKHIETYKKEIHQPWEDIRKFAYEIARRSHHGQLRKSGEDYFFAHSQRVADILLAYFKRDGTSSLTKEGEKFAEALAYLHDVVEDTSFHLQKIKKVFGEEVYQIIFALTEDREKRKRYERKIETKEMTKNEMKKKLLADSLEKIQSLKKNLGERSFLIAAMIRSADILQNLEDYDDQDESLQKRNREKARIIYEAFREELPFVEKIRERLEEIEAVEQKSM